MTKNKLQDSAKSSTTSAPELPAHVAREYGLHHEPKEETTVEATETEQTATKDDETIPETTSVDDPKTDKAVDEIVAKESDDLLAIQDGMAPAAPTSVPKRGFWKKIGHFFVVWWRNKTARWITIAVILVALGTLLSIPTTRYALLNTVGVRSSASVVVLDNTTSLPLKNVTVAVGKTSAKTNIEGRAILKGLKLGKQPLTIKRLAFAQYKKQITIGWGSNPLGEHKLTAVGLQYVLQVNDFLSGKPIEGVEAVSDQVNALSDKQGKIILTAEDAEATKLDVTVGGAGYRREAVTLDATATEPKKLALVPAQKDVFVSKESGKYDVYSVDLDGKNRKMILAATGNENDNISLAMSPDGTQAALVSTRDNMRDSDGYLLHTLTFISVTEGTSVTIDHAQQIQLVDWSGTRLVYRSTVAGSSAANSQRNRLIAYNHKTNSRVQLATANQFNTILSANGIIYYGASSNDPNATLGLFKVKPDGGNRERISGQEIWTGLRTAYNTISIQSPDGWYAYDLATGKMSKTTPPAQFINFTFIKAPESERTVWTDTRDGKGVLLMRTSDGKTTTLAAQSGLTQPVRWAGERAIVYRVVTSNESASYVVSPDGGAGRKIADVTVTYSFAQAY